MDTYDLCMRSSEIRHQDQRKRDYDLDSFDAMVTVIVGHPRKSFRLHKSLLCQTSNYFDAALNGGFKEAKEQKNEMLEEDVETFRHFQFWIYCKAIKMTNDKECDIEWKQLLDLFVFGEARGIPDLANADIDGVVEKQDVMEWAPSDQIVYIYDNTIPKSPLRQLFIDFTIKHCKMTDDSWFSDTTFQLYTKEFLFDLAVAQCEVRKGLRSVVVDFRAKRRNYHISGSDQS